MIVRGKEIIKDGIPDIKEIKDCINEFVDGLDRLNRLKDYFHNKNAILDRQRQKHLPNNRLVHSYAQYIVGVASGYLLGEPVKYTSVENIDKLIEAFKSCDVASVDCELAEDAGVYGVATEIVYLDEEGNIKCAKIDRLNAFVVYDDTVEAKPLIGIRWIKSRKGDIKVFVYTDKNVFTYEGKDLRDFDLTATEKHYFNAVPIIEYWNNGKEEGDFEPIISLIDAYDRLQSDRINDKGQFVDSVLMLYGIRELAPPEDENDTRSTQQRISEDKVLALPQDARAEYLYKQLSEADVEILRKALQSDIHKFSRVPDLSDENFSGNTSGVAMKYKLFGLEQLTKTKERWFTEGLKQRLRIFFNLLTLKGQRIAEPRSIAISFSRSLPVNELEVAQTIRTLSGMVPEELLIAQVPFVNDTEQALKLLEEERQNQKETVDEV